MCVLVFLDYLKLRGKGKNDSKLMTFIEVVNHAKLR